MLPRPQTPGGSEEAAAQERGSHEEEEVEFRPNYERGCSYYFGRRAIRRFLDENSLLCLIRAHQVQEQGYMEHFVDPSSPPPLKHKHGKRRSSGAGGGAALTRENLGARLPLALTVFSAPNYAGRYGNKVTMGMHGFERGGRDPSSVSFAVPKPPPRLPLSHHTTTSTPHTQTEQAAFLRVGLEPEEMAFEQFACVPPPFVPSKLPWAELAMSSGA